MNARISGIKAFVDSALVSWGMFFLSILFFSMIMLVELVWWNITDYRKHEKSMPAECQIIGNQDLYGIGIWVGVYLQLISTTFVAALGSRQLAGTISSTNICFYSLYLLHYQ